jgi:hypothetical protein
MFIEGIADLGIDSEAGVVAEAFPEGFPLYNFILEFLVHLFEFALLL